MSGPRRGPVMADALPCPSWCSENECDVHGVTVPNIGGAHRSDPIKVDFGPLTSPDRFLFVYLYQPGAPEPGAVHLVFEVGDLTAALPVDPHGHEFALELVSFTGEALTAAERSAR